MKFRAVKKVILVTSTGVCFLLEVYCGEAILADKHRQSISRVDPTFKITDEHNEKLFQLPIQNNLVYDRMIEVPITYGTAVLATQL